MRLSFLCSVTLVGHHRCHYLTMFCTHHSSSHFAKLVLTNSNYFSMTKKWKIREWKEYQDFLFFGLNKECIQNKKNLYSLLKGSYTNRTLCYLYSFNSWESRALQSSVYVLLVTIAVKIMHGVAHLSYWHFNSSKYINWTNFFRNTVEYNFVFDENLL